MPLPGGTSDKLGNRYEGRWTAVAILEVLQGEAGAIRLEPPGAEGEGVEFYVRYSDHTNFHQVKRQRAAGDWTIAALRRAGVLHTFLERLTDAAARCTFVSAHSASSLQDLTEKARSALSWAEYERDFVISKKGKADLASLKAAWGNPADSMLLDALRRIYVETISEERLRRYALLQAEMVLQGDQPQALPALVDIVLNNINRYLTADELWRELAAYNFTPSMWSRPTQAAVRVSDANARYVESRRATLIQGQLIPRPEAKQLAEAISTHRLVLLDGVAGMGKSDVILQFVEDLESRGIPHLVFRLDHTTPTRRPEELGHDLGLPGSPTAVLAAVAQGREAVLVIDQLDAVSATSGRNPQFLECVSDIVRTAQSSPRLLVVLVCRTFDIQNDARLLQALGRGKDYRAVTVGPLDRSVLNEVLPRLGYGPGTLRDAQVELLRVPLHLALLAGAIRGETGYFDFATSLDLHSEFWRRKRQDLDQRLGGDCWVPIVERLVDYMSEQQVLRAPVAIVDQWEPYVDAMVSANVLTRDSGQLAFFHETFFDYAFARTLIGRQGSIRSLLSHDQFLFRRAQVRQILAHERLTPGNEYKRDLSYLIQEPGVRFHLKDLVISWLSQISPTSLEWSLIEPLLGDASSPLFGRAWRLLVSVDWFKYVDAVGFIPNRLQTEDELTDAAASVVATVVKSFPVRTAELLSPYSDNPKWTRRIGSVISQADLSASRALFELCLKWVDQLDSVMDEQTVAEFVHPGRELGKKNPQWGCELLAHFLRRRVVLARDAGFDNPFEHEAGAFPADLHLEEFVSDIASAAPAAYVEHVWPVMFQVIEHTSRDSRSGGLRLDPIWSYRHLRVASLEDSLLTAAEAGFRYAARSQQDVFDRLLSEQLSTGYETVVYMLYQGFAAEPVRYADTAVEFLVADERNLRVRYSNGAHWGTRQLLEAITPYASGASLARLQETLLAYSPDRGRWHGWVQFELLGGIAKGRRSDAVAKRIGELQRKFEIEDVPPPEGIVGGTVRSPIEPAAASRMTDEQWRRAIAKHSADHRERDHGRDFLKGGAEELANVLATEASRDPERFARLGSTLDDGAHDAYFDALLRGVAEAKQQPSLASVQKLIERCHSLRGRPCGRWIARPLVKHAKDELPDELLDIVSWYALHDPDPAVDRDRSDNELELMNEGLNSARGSIASEIAELVQANPQRYGRMEAAICALCSDRVAAVRAMAAQIVCGLVASAPEHAQALFLQLVEGTDERILASRYVHLYLRWQAVDDFAILRPLLERMIASRFSSVREYGAAHMNLVALSHEEARDAADACVSSSDVALRLGAVRVFASNLEAYPARCSVALKSFFNDESPKIRKVAGNALWRMQGAQLGDHVDLANAFLESAAFAANADDLIHALRETTAPVPELMIATCTRALDAFELTRSGPLVYQTSEALSLVLRAYADTDDPAEKNRALDILDRSLVLGIYGPHKLLAEHDRWWDKP